MNEIVTQELTDRDYAKQVAVMYVASFANQPHEPDVMLGQVRDFLIGKPKSVVDRVCNPNCGAVTRSDRPCLKSLCKWVDDWMGTRTKLSFRPTREDPPEDPPDVKDAAVERWRRAKAAMAVPRAPAKPLPKPRQQHDPDALLRALGSNVEVEA